MLLFFRFSQDFSPGQAFYHSIYNAISAFNNCGYSLFSDNLIQYQSDVIVNITIMGLIVLGGIGFIVQHEVMSRMRNTRNRLSLHTKIVLATTGILVVGGAVLFYLLEKQYHSRCVLAVKGAYFFVPVNHTENSGIQHR